MRMREEAVRWRRLWGLVRCPQMSMTRACVLVVAGNAQSGLVGHWGVNAALNSAVHAPTEAPGAAANRDGLSPVLRMNASGDSEGPEWCTDEPLAPGQHSQVQRRKNRHMERGRG
jgi:hypothetical protein